MDDLSEPQPPYLFDTCSLFKLEESSDLGLLSELGDWVVIPEVVIGEVDRNRHPDLSQWLQSHPNHIVSFSSEEDELFKRLLERKPPKLGAGEAGAVAMAHYRRGTIVSDDKVIPSVVRRNPDLRVRRCGTDEFLSRHKLRLLP